MSRFRKTINNSNLGSGRSTTLGRNTMPGGGHSHPMTGVNPAGYGAGPYVQSHVHSLPVNTGRHVGGSSHSHGRTGGPMGSYGPNSMDAPYHTHPVNRGGSHNQGGGHNVSHGHTYGLGGWQDSSGMATGHTHGMQSGGALWAPHSHQGGAVRGGRSRNLPRRGRGPRGRRTYPGGRKPIQGRAARGRRY